MLGNYTLTSRLLGDPRPDRLEYSERLRSISNWRPSGHQAAQYVPQQPAERRICTVLRAIADGNVTTVTIASSTGISRDMASAYLKRARDQDLIEIASQVNSKAGGRIYQYSLTESGKEELRRFVSVAA